jgi:hypothetical protein
MGEEQMKEFFAEFTLVSRSSERSEEEILPLRFLPVVRTQGQNDSKSKGHNDRRKFQNDTKRRARNNKRWRAQNLLLSNVQPILSPSFMELSLAGVGRRR